MSLFASRDLAPAPWRRCWHGLLKRHARANSERLTRKDVSFCTNLPLALAPVCGAFRPVTLAACANVRPAMPAGLLFCQLACLQTDCAMAQHGAPVSAGRGQLGVKARVRRAAAQLGASWSAPPRRRAARRGQARDGALIWPRQRAGRAVWLTADSAWNTLATASEHSGRAPSLRRRQTVADSALGWSCGPT
jgi:hypothetical protein